MGAPTLFLTDPNSHELMRRRYWLHVVEGPDVPRRVEIRETPALVGAAPAAALVLSDDTVSRYHAEVEPQAHGVRVRDLDSTNGTFFDAALRSRIGFVPNGGRFRVGQTVVRVVAQDEVAASETETDPHLTPPGEVEVLGGLRAAASKSKALFRTLRRIAEAPGPVLLHGPVGTGKGALARVLHDESGRAGPFRALSTAIAPPTSLPRMLFGKGGEPGLIEQAQGGTFYLEDVELVPPPILARLAELKAHGEVVAEGETTPRRVDLAWVLASTKPLPELLQLLPPGLVAIHLGVEALTERREDLPHLAEALLLRGRKGPLRLGATAKDLLLTQRFPRNLKDLEALLTRALTFGPTPASPFEAQLRSELLAGFLEHHQGHVGRTAQALGVPERTLLQALKHAGVDLGL